MNRGRTLIVLDVFWGGQRGWPEEGQSHKQTHTSQLQDGDLVHLDAMYFLHRQKGIHVIIKGITSAGGIANYLLKQTANKRF